MIYADLYIRVSTDEQADRGYSQRDQEERLKNHCLRLGIFVDRVIFEDHSAKSFNRPEWKNYMAGFSRKKAEKEGRLLLFTKWDRFSRNTSEAYQMIDILKKKNVTPQAIEQPLDLNIPENKLLLAVYLSTPEVENDRRALNTIGGMRRAIKEGRLMGVAPYGYINRCTEDGRKYVAVKQPEADNIKWAFQEVAKGHMPMAHIVKQMNKRDGKKLSYNRFTELVRSVTYCGNLLLPAYGNEESRIVKGKHEAIISEELFLKVQNVLRLKRSDDTNMPSGKVFNDDQYPLRGLLICPLCGANLTASASKGRRRYYSYYHCKSPCTFRHSADVINDLLIKELTKFSFHSGIKELLKDIILCSFKDSAASNKDNKEDVQERIVKLNERISKARDMFLSDKIDEDDFKDIKDRYKDELSELEFKLSTMKSNPIIDIEKKIEGALNSMTNIAERYEKGSISDKRAIIGSIYPEKLIFEKDSFRTAKLNRFAERIFLIKNGLGQKKSGIQNFENFKSRLVPGAGVEPARFPTGV